MNMKLGSIAAAPLEGQRYPERAQTDLLTDIFATGDSLAIRQVIGIVANARGQEVPVWCQTESSEPSIPDLCSAINGFGFRVIVLPKMHSQYDGATEKRPETARKPAKTKI